MSSPDSQKYRMNLRGHLFVRIKRASCRVDVGWVTDEVRGTGTGPGPPGPDL